MPHPNNRIILLIDDDQSMHKLIHTHLEKSDFQVLSAYNTTDGLESILEHQPDLVLLDYMLPDMNGEEAFNEIMSNPRFDKVCNIPIIMLTAMEPQRSHKSTMLERGIGAYLQKPFGLRELTNVIDNVFITHEIKVRNQHLRTEIESTRDYLELIMSSTPIEFFLQMFMAVYSMLTWP